MIHTTRLEESYKQRLWQGKDCFSSKLQIICSKGSAAPNGSLYFPGKAVLWTMDPAPCYVLELLKLLTEFSFNLLLKIKLSFFGICSFQPLWQHFLPGLVSAQGNLLLGQECHPKWKCSGIFINSM